MKGKVPKKVKVGAVDYTVQLLPEDISNQFGATVYSHQKIYLTPNMLHQQASDTLLHEIFHALWAERGLDVIPDLNEETVIRALATGLRTVIRDNPAVLQFITDASGMWPYGPTSDPVEEATS